MHLFLGSFILINLNKCQYSGKAKRSDCFLICSGLEQIEMSDIILLQSE